MFKKTLIKGQGSFWENFKFVLRIKKYVDNDPIFINRIFAHYVIRCAERMLKRVAYLYVIVTFTMVSRTRHIIHIAFFEKRILDNYCSNF